jgi:hypothetical protein
MYIPIIILRPFRALNIIGILTQGVALPARQDSFWRGLKYFPLSGETDVTDIRSESLIIIDKNIDMYIP